MLRNDIQFSNRCSNVKSVLITSATEGEGKTTTAANLAISMAKSGKKTLLIDCDINNPGINILFDTANHIGLSTLIKEENYNERAIIESEFQNLYILNTGSDCDNSSEIFGCKKMQQLLKTFNEKYDFVVIDTPAITELCDAQIISQYVDGCILVVGAGDVDLEEVKRAKELLQKVNAKILGVVLNKTSSKEKSKKHTKHHRIKSKRTHQEMKGTENCVGGYVTE
jgi:protein-tyrosine kinase